MIAKLRRIDIPTLRAAWWTFRALRRVHRDLRREGLNRVRLPRVPSSLPAHAQRGVAAVLRRRSSTCLEEATVRQAWHAAHGERRDLIIGVTSPAQGFRAHAWLEGDQASNEEEFRELLRRPVAQ